MNTLLGMPALPNRETLKVAEGVHFSTHGHYFMSSLSDQELSQFAAASTAPLSVILQVTRRCNFDCNFCSETMPMRDPSLKDLEQIRVHLNGVPRVFLSGGEPLLRRDFTDIVQMFSDFIIGVPTNGTRGVSMADKLAGKVAFMNVGLEGPRNATNRVRGDYDKIMSGVLAFRNAGLEVSLSSVVLRSLVSDLPYLIQIADVVKAGKVKLIHPIRKGNGAALPDSEFLSLAESAKLFERLTLESKLRGWTPSIRMTTWTRETEGYSILIYPDGSTWAWPVYGGTAYMGTQGGSEDKTLFLGSLKDESIQTIWTRYPFKENHLRKYLGKSIHVSDNGEVYAPRRKQPSKRE